MKKIVLHLVVLLITTTGFSQDMPKSKKLGETNGISTLDLTKTYESEIKGLSPIAEGETPWSNLKSEDYMYDQFQIGDPKTLKVTSMYGLNVERIEVFTSKQEIYDKNDKATGEEGTGIYAIAVFLTLPESEEALMKFYSEFKAAYAPMLDYVGYDRELEVELLQWHSTTSCGAMMNIPSFSSLEECKELDIKYLELKFVPSCGG